MFCLTAVPGPAGDAWPDAPSTPTALLASADPDTHGHRPGSPDPLPQLLSSLCFPSLSTQVGCLEEEEEEEKEGSTRGSRGKTQEGRRGRVRSQQKKKYPEEEPEEEEAGKRKGRGAGKGGATSPQLVVTATPRPGSVQLLFSPPHPAGDGGQELAAFLVVFLGGGILGSSGNPKVSRKWPWRA